MVSKVQENQSLVLENLINYRGKVSQQIAISVFEQVNDILRKNNAVANGGPITITHAVAIENGQQVLDFELFFPINKEISVSGDFKFIPSLEVKNALKIRFEGNPQNSNLAIQELQGYINKNSFKPVTPVYMVSVKQPRTVEELNETITDFYVGVKR